MQQEVAKLWSLTAAPVGKWRLPAKEPRRWRRREAVGLLYQGLACGGHRRSRHQHSPYAQIPVDTRRSPHCCGRTVAAALTPFFPSLLFTGNEKGKERKERGRMHRATEESFRSAGQDPVTSKRGTKLTESGPDYMVLTWVNLYRLLPIQRAMLSIDR